MEENLSPHRVFLLSPANLSGKRAKMLLNPIAQFELAVRLRQGRETQLGEVFSFVSGLYFRGKLSYARAFAKSAESLPGVFIITSSKGLVAAETLTTTDELLDLSKVPIDSANENYSRPLIRDAGHLAASYSGPCSFVLLGSVASNKYVDLLLPIFRERLHFPEEFVGRGDMSRGGLLLRRAAENRMLTHVPVRDSPRRGPKAPKISPLNDSLPKMIF
jgi:hypothetical protein